METMTIDELVLSALAEEFGDATHVTPYQVIKVANAIFVAIGKDKKLPTQMAYNYVAKGYIKSEIVNGQRLVTAEGAAEWLTKYFTKGNNK